MARVVKLQVARSLQARVGDPVLPLAQAAKDVLMPVVMADTRPEPQILPDEPKTPITLWLSDAEEARVREQAEAAGASSMGIYLSRLLHAVISDPATAERYAIDRVTQALGKPSRPAQREFSNAIAKALVNAPAHSVILAEAATGIGKSLGFLAVVLESLEREPERPVIVSAPSYTVLHQSFADWRAMVAALPGLPEGVMVMGQQEFVSEHSLATLLNEIQDEEREAWGKCAAYWMAAGAPAPAGSGLSHAWTQAGLREACPEFPHADTVRVTSDSAESDAGRAAYRGQFEATDCEGRAVRPRVVFATHAMLAVEVKIRRMAAQRAFRSSQGISAGTLAWAEVEEQRAQPAVEGDFPIQSYHAQNDMLRLLDEEEGDAASVGRLPDNALVIIDEAHLLEEGFARMFANGESVWRLSSAARTVAESPAISEAKRSALRASLAKLTEARDRLRLLGVQSGGATDRVVTRSSNAESGDAEVLDVLTILHAALAPFVGKQAQFKRGASDPDAERAQTRIRRAVEALSVGLRDNAEQVGVGMRVSWSPTMAWPSFEAGRLDVSGPLDFLWSNFADRSVCVSATLMTGTGIDPAAAIQRMLGIRPNRGVVLKPIHPMWVTLPVEVRTPPPAEGRPHPEWLCYPRAAADGRRPPEELQIWLQDVSHYIAEIVIDNEARQRGGVLVLLTSHADRAAISEQLAARLGVDAVVSQQPGRPLDAVKSDFLARRRRGVIAVLVGVGACWTGLDLSDPDPSIPPERDQIITDLVIPRLPIGTNRTLTHLARKRRLDGIGGRSQKAEMIATAVTLRQGVGRLVRRQGVTGRVLHMLDGRTDRKDGAWPGYRGLADRILGVYPNRIFIRPGKP
jgi:CRISPR type IV-associated DEAD/DEAH-box helicase Csf4